MEAPENRKEFCNDSGFLLIFQILYLKGGKRDDKIDDTFISLCDFVSG